MWAARDSMRAQGVRYAGESRHSESAARAIAGLKSPLSDEGNPPPIRLWEELVRSIHRATEPRLIFSSEFLAHAHEDAIRRLVDDIDPARIHVAVTLRPLGKILASQWQQSVQAANTASFDAWLDSLFNRPAGSREAVLWHRHRHDRLIARWAGIVGPDKVTAVVVDDRDHAHVLRMFEALLGLRVGTLELQQDLANRSLTLAEVEALRAFNESYGSADLGRALRTRVVRLGRRLAHEVAPARPRRGADRDAAVGPGPGRRGRPRDGRQHLGLRRAHRGRPRPPDRGADEQARRRPAAGGGGPADHRRVDVDRDPHRGRLRARRGEGARRGDARARALEARRQGASTGASAARRGSRYWATRRRIQSSLARR